MNKCLILSASLVLMALAGCGVDGEPSRPELDAGTTIGVNSRDGAYIDTSLGVGIRLGG